MTPIILPYKKNRKNLDEELRYCLRSIEKNLIGAGELIIVGDKPDWLINCHHIYKEDYPNHRESSIANKVIAGAEYLKTGSFTRIDDDYIILKPMEVEDIKSWHSDDLTKWLASKGTRGMYRDTIHNTQKRYGNCPYYDIHAPMVMEVEKVMKMEFIRKEKPEILFKTSYMMENNLIGEPSPEKDLKIGAAQTERDLQSLFRNRTFVSIHDHSWNMAMETWLKKLFPERSKWEWR